MLDLKELEGRGKSGIEFQEKYRLTLKKRGYSTEILDEILEMAQVRRQLLVKTENIRSQQKKMGQVLAKIKNDPSEFNKLKTELDKLSDDYKELNRQLEEMETQIQVRLLQLPNMLDDRVPEGKDSNDNVVIHHWGEPREFDFSIKDHIQLGYIHDGLDFERASKVAGSRFAFLKKNFARLERALIHFFLDEHIKNGYVELIPPYIVNTDSYQSTGQFPKFWDEVFHTENDQYHLISTAEIPVTNYYRGEILPENILPIKFCAFSPCFRREAGSYGADIKGLIRQHQFHKVELVIFCKPEESSLWHERMTQDAEALLQKLGLPYRRVLLCSGDLGFAASICYDLEVWIPSQKRYREISSCSNFKDFQSRRAQIRYKSSSGSIELVHTLNGSGLAVGRTLIAIVENYQNSDGSITVPEVLRPYLGCDLLVPDFQKK